MLKKIFYVSMFVGIILVFLFVRRGSFSDDTLRLGVMSPWPPYVSLNEKGLYEGFDMDVANEVAKKLGKKLVVKDMDLASLITALNFGNIDFIMTGFSITPYRLKKIDMIPYQGEYIKSLFLVFWGKLPEVQIKTFNDIKLLYKPIICVEAGSSPEEIISQYSGFELLEFDPLMSVKELKYGKATASLMEEFIYYELKQKFPQLCAIEIPLKPEEIIKGNGIGTKKGSELSQEISKIISDFKTSGFMRSRELIWFKKSYD